MARYIDAVICADTISEKLNIPLGDLVDVFAEVPTSDVVEVVRCKDCEHGHWNQETLFGRCVDFCDYTDLRINKEHFCSYGKRKTDNAL